MLRQLCGTLAIVMIPAVVLAAAKPSDRKGNFSCVATTDFESMLGDWDTVRMNNFTMNEKLGGKRVSAGIKVTYAITNSASFEVFTSSDFILFDADGQPLAALTAGPPQLSVAAQSAAIATGVTLVAPGTLAETRSICFRSMVVPK